MYKYPYLLSKKRLAEKIPALKDIDIYKGQDNRKGKLLVSPGLYFRFLPTETESLGDGIQAGVVEVELILLQDNLLDDDKMIDDPDTLDHLDLVDLINKYYSGYSDFISSLDQFASLKDTPNDWKPMNTVDRISVDLDTDNGSILKTVQKFKFYCKDYSGNKTWTKIVTEIELVINNLTLE